MPPEVGPTCWSALPEVESRFGLAALPRLAASLSFLAAAEERRGGMKDNAGVRLSNQHRHAVAGVLWDRKGPKNAEEGAPRWCRRCCEGSEET